ncbi:MAG TPA: hypothetical protein VJ985_06225 [Gammaproteobacteria bacterium]|nr:hypothetical protein [Gammaproteobacteria bacterium]
MIAKTILVAGVLALLIGGIGGLVTGFTSTIFGLMPVGALLVMIGTVESLNRKD